jgi:hypothetical protein
MNFKNEDVWDMYRGIKEFMQGYSLQVQAGGETLCPRSINSLILFGIRKNCLISGRSLLLYQFT